MMRNTWTVRVSGTITTTGHFLIYMGQDSALAPFPCMSSFTTVQATLNNNTFNLNQSDVIQTILRSNDSRHLSSMNSGSPTYLDEYRNYSDALGQINNPLGSYGNAIDPDILPRGSYYIDKIIDEATGVAPVVSTGNAQASVYQITFTTTEPLLLSPFLLGNEDANDSGIYGIVAMNFVFNVGSGSRIIRSASSQATGLTCSLLAVNNSELHMVYLTPHPSTLLAPRVCVPYYDLNKSGVKKQVEILC
jgi:hypothetical protein